MIIARQSLDQFWFPSSIEHAIALNVCTLQQTDNNSFIEISLHGAVDIYRNSLPHSSLYRHLQLADVLWPGEWDHGIGQVKPPIQ